MGKLLLFSVVAASAVLPLLAAREPDPRRGLRRAVWHTFLADLFFVLVALYVYPRL